jgi:peptidoglycan/xylan/chitin deacetylase (PgdA/CDA1 family)
MGIGRSNFAGRRAVCNDACMNKRRVKYLGAALAERLGVWAMLERAHRRAWTIACYHRVLPAAQREAYFSPSLVVTPEAFAAHCALYARHFEVLTVAEGQRRMAAGEFGRKPLLSLSFDDGYRDNVQHAVPILEEHRLRATFCIIAGLVDTETLPWYDRVARAVQVRGAAVLPAEWKLPEQPDRRALARAALEVMKRLPWDKTQDWTEKIAAAAGDLGAPNEADLIVSSAQLKVLQARGHEIAAHSMSHPVLTRVQAEDLPEEVSGARERLEGFVGSPVRTFCYPNGDFDARVLAAVGNGGFSSALSTRQGLNHPGGNPFTLARVFIEEDWFRGTDDRQSSSLLRAELALLHRFRAGGGAV